jgi:hypothetical protein
MTRAQAGISQLLYVFQQPQQIRGQRRKLGSRHRTLRVYDDVPSCGYLQPVAAHDLTQTPPDTIAHYRAAQGFLDAEAESALRQFVGAEKNGEVGTRTALSGAVHSIKLSASHQPRFARIQIPVRT